MLFLLKLELLTFVKRVINLILKSKYRLENKLLSQYNDLVFLIVYYTITYNIYIHT